MQINVKHVAKLANLQITEDEEKKYAKQLSDVLEYVKKLEEVQTDKVEETAQVTGLVNIKRDDLISPSLTQEEALQSAPTPTQKGFFQVPGILDQG